MSDEKRWAEPEAIVAKAVELLAHNEVLMHYSECLEWVAALEWYIKQNGLEVPTWKSVNEAGFKYEPEALDL